MPEEMNETTEVVETTPTPEAEAGPVVPISEGVTRADDTTDDAALEDIFGPEETEEPVAAKEEPAEQTTEVAEATEDTDGETRAEPDSDDYAKAVAALQRDGVPRSVIDEMAEENPQQLVDWGLKRSKVQADVDGYGARLKELEEGTAQTGDENAQEATEAVTPDQGDGQPGANEYFNRYESEIGEIFGDDAAKAVLSPIRELVSETANALQMHQHALQQMQMTMEMRDISESRERLGERFPKLSNDDDFGVVVEQMTKLAQVGEYESFDDLMTDAYRMKFAEVAKREAESESARNKRDTGQPTTTFTAKTPARSMSGEDREDAALEALLSGGSADEANAAYNK